MGRAKTANRKCRGRGFDSPLPPPERSGRGPERWGGAALVSTRRRKASRRPGRCPRIGHETINANEDVYLVRSQRLTAKARPGKPALHAGITGTSLGTEQAGTFTFTVVRRQSNQPPAGGAGLEPAEGRPDGSPLRLSGRRTTSRSPSSVSPPGRTSPAASDSSASASSATARSRPARRRRSAQMQPA